LRRKITLTLVISVTSVILIAGFGVLLLSRQISANQGKAFLTRTARTIIATQTSHPYLAREIVRIAGLNGAHFETLYASGKVSGNINVLPASIRNASTSNPGVIYTLTKGSHVFAAVDIPLDRSTARGQVTGLIVVLQKSIAIPPRSILFLVLVAAAATLIAWLVGEAISARITRPILGLQEVTRKLAEGETGIRPEIINGHYPEIEDLSNSISQMAASLERSEELQKDFFMAISHDLRTPLTSVSGFAEAILDETVDDPKQAAAVILKESKRLEVMVRDLLELSRIQAGRFKLEISRVEASQLVDDLAEIFSLRAAEAVINFHYQGLKAPQLVDLDPNRFTQMLQNLLENAYKFAATTIRLDAGPTPDGDLRISVLDDGPGIPLADQPKVFRHAHRNDKTPSREQGSGVGLLIVSELAHTMGLRVGFKSPLDESGGTEMLVIIPNKLLKNEASAASSS
jgi:signal transduction histidine kinase